MARLSFDRSFACKLLAAAVCAIAACSPAPAADNTRYVSITGSNANPCTLAKPCRSLQRAISVTPVGGEIQILDSGSFGNNATIKKSLTISGNGHTVYLGVPITIDQAGAVVTLRGLTLDGQGTVGDGISIMSAAAVQIERCVIHHFTQHGIVNYARHAKVFVLDSTSRNNVHGLRVFAALTLLMIDGSHFDGNGSRGVFITAGDATISRSTASGNGCDGILALSASVSVVSTVAALNACAGFGVGQDGSMTLESSVADGNRHGLSGGSGCVARISNSSFTNNSLFGIGAVGCTVETRQNNTVRGNGTNVDATLTPLGAL